METAILDDTVQDRKHLETFLSGMETGGVGDVKNVQAHIGEACSEGFVVRADQRVRQHIDMVADDHQIAYMKRMVDASGRI